MTTTQHVQRAQTPVSSMKDFVTRPALTVLATCLALLAPGIASAGKPAPDVDAQCTLLLSPDPQYVYTGGSFLVKLARDPAYPGAFRQPRVVIDVSYPASSGGVIKEQFDSGTIPRFDITYVEHPFNVPAGVAVNGTATVTGTVTEPLTKKGNKVRTTICTTTATVVQGN